MDRGQKDEPAHTGIHRFSDERVCGRALDSDLLSRGFSVSRKASGGVNDDVCIDQRLETSCWILDIPKQNVCSL